MAQISCTQCESINLQINVAENKAVCNNCYNEMNVSAILEKSFSLKHKIIEQPQGLKKSKDLGAILYTLESRKHRSWKVPIFVGILMLLFSSSIIYFVEFNSLDSLISMLIFIVWCLISLFILLEGIYNLFNVQYIRFDRREISVHNKVPHFLRKRTYSFPIKNIEQFFVSGRMEGTEKSNKVYTYKLKIKYANNEEEKLLDFLTNENIAYYFEKEFEKILKIQDKYVIGEIHPSKPLKKTSIEQKAEIESLMSGIRNEAYKTTHRCKQCNVLILEEWINKEKEITVCKQCNEVFEFSNTLIENEVKTTHKNITEPPEKLEVIEQDGKIVAKLPNGEGYGSMVFMLLFIGLFFSFSIYLEGQKVSIDQYLYAFLIPVFFAVIFFIKSYELKVFTLQKNTLIISKERSILKGVASKFEKESIVQLYVDAQKRQKGKNGSYFVYNLNIEQTDGYVRTLLENQKNPRIPLYLEKVIEAWYNIEDEIVEGEYNPSKNKGPKNLYEALSLAKEMMRIYREE